MDFIMVLTCSDVEHLLSAFWSSVYPSLETSIRALCPFSNRIGFIAVEF